MFGIDAVKKIREQYDDAEYDKYTPDNSRESRATAMIAKPITNALCEFCNKNEAFAKVILESDKNLKDCVLSIANNLPFACPDVVVYSKAVKFYAPEADVNVEMNIKFNSADEHKAQIIQLDLLDLFN